jgi:hypothetical protein
VLSAVMQITVPSGIFVDGANDGRYLAYLGLSDGGDSSLELYSTLNLGDQDAEVHSLSSVLAVLSLPNPHAVSRACIQALHEQRLSLTGRSRDYGPSFGAFAQVHAGPAWTGKLAGGSLSAGAAWNCAECDGISVGLDLSSTMRDASTECLPVSLRLRASATQGSVSGTLDRSSVGMSYKYESLGASTW